MPQGQWLAENNLASATVDVTDGLAKELNFLPSESASVLIDLKAIPIAQNSTENSLKKALCDGEDYELLFTLHHSIEEAQFKADWKQLFPETPLTQIGRIIEKNSLSNIIDSDTQKPVAWLKSFDHFNRR